MSEYVILVHFMETLSNINNYVTIYVVWVYYSNGDKSLTLVKESLDLIYASSDNYFMYA